MASTPSGSMAEQPRTPSLFHHQLGSSVSVSAASALTRKSLAYDDDFRCRTMVTYLGNRICASGWAPPPMVSNQRPEDCFGVLLRKSRGQYVCSPENIHPQLLDAVQRLNVAVAFTMRPDMLDGILSGLAPNQSSLVLTDGSQVQILASLASISGSTVKKFQYCCFLRQESLVLVWHDDLEHILPHATRLEEKLLSLVWGKGALPMSLLPPLSGSRPASVFPGSEISVSPTPVLEKSPQPINDADSQLQLDNDESTESPESLARPVVLNSAVFIGMAVGFGIFLVFGLANARLFSDSLLDGKWSRLGLIAAGPFLFLAGLFFFQAIFGNLFQIIGPIGCYTTNSRFYSPKRPSLRRAYQDGFVPPHITIQMPVYKEGLHSVIKPTVRSLQAAMSYYESHGGTASIFINDDGLRLIPEADAQARKDFYHDNNIGWVARPGDKDNGFVRKGKFKKASNMNFALNISCKVETCLQDMVSNKCKASGMEEEMLDEDEEHELYEAALAQVLGENPIAQAAGNIRVGDYILIVDSDTRVPVDCLLFGAAEMFLSPEVAIIQHNTGVMQVSWDYFENGITFFTNLIYTAICFAIGSGEVAPFVGHNAFLRWAAVQAVGRQEDGGYVAYWSESHVSEDFDMALRLQIAGSIVRIARYHGDGFQEGVSLTIYDEIARWQKYAYGCSEMVFHPLHRWPMKGPFSPLIRQFLGSKIVLSSKVAIFAYICTYFAIGAALPLTILNYFLIGWYGDVIDHFYLESWKVLVSILVVFNLMGNVALAIVRYRTGQKTLLGAMWENFKWMPFMAIFFGGLSFHVSSSLLAHLLHIDMQWGATSKEKEDSNFFQEIPRILKTFKYMYAMVFLFTGGMIYLARFAPRGWVIDDFAVIVPMSIVIGSHALTPLVLNPSLMIFNY